MILRRSVHPFIVSTSLIVLTSLWPLSSCTMGSQVQPSLNEADALQAIAEARGRFMQAMADADFAAVSEIAHTDAIMIGAGGPEHLEMYAEAGAGLAPGYRIDISPVETVIINQEWAFERGTSVQSWQPNIGGERIEVPNSYLIILRNTEGRWQPYREVASALPPPGGWPEPKR